MRIKHTFLFTLFLGLGWAGLLFAYQNGPDPGSNGIFGTGTACNQAGCHVGNPLNAAGGTLTLAGLPAEWTPGQTYPLTVTIQKSGALTYGFQMSAVFDTPSSPQAGVLTKTFSSGTNSTRISIVSGGGVQYAQHNQTNASLVAATQFFVNWTAPTTGSGGAVRFNVAANAANNNSQITGDFIYTIVDKRSPGASIPADFSLAATPDSVTVTAGNNITYSTSATGLNGFTGAVALSVSGLPTGATGTFSPTSVNAGAASTLTIATTSSVAAGSYPLTVTGVSGSLSHTASLTLVVTPGTNSSRAFALTNFSSNSSSTDGTGALGVGYARISATSGTTPAGVEIFGYRSNNVLVSETGVPASPLITSGRIYAEVGGAVNTGLAIANPNATAATITFFFTNSSGTDTASRTTTIAANNQLARFLDQDPWLGGTNIQGTFSFTSSVPVSVVALRGFTNEVRGDFLITTLPVIDTAAAASTGTQVLPHFYNGGGWTTQVILVNPGSTTLTGALQFVNPTGVPATLTIAGVSTNSPAYSVPPKSAQKIVLGGPETGGSVRVVPAAGGPSPTPLVVFSFKPANITLSEAGAPANGGTAFRMYVESSGTDGRPGNIQSGIAVANGGAASVTATFELFNTNGTAAGFTTTKVIPAGGQTASFLAQLFNNLPQPFSGVLRISAPTSISVVGLRGRYNERSEFLITTTPPALESATASAAELLFPHLVNGGGYTTQFILFSGAAGQSSGGTIRFFKTDGTVLGLLLNQ